MAARVDPGDGDALPTVTVKQHQAPAVAGIPDVGAVVTARVTAINPRNAHVDIVCVGSTTLKQSFSGVIRKENVLATETDRVTMEQCCRPGDVIVAEVRACCYYCYSCDQ